MLELRWGAATHEGLVRDMNEDAFLAEPGMYVVADGMGGHSAGEVASAIAVDSLRRGMEHGYRRMDDVTVAIRIANATIRAEAGASADRAGMGTTLTALVVLDEEEHVLALANVGDSRTYRRRAGRLSRLTIDHSYVQELVQEGQITLEEARLHPRRNIVTRALGIDPRVKVDTWTITAATGDRYVLCSDGLVDEVPDHEIAELLAGVSDPQAAADQLVAMANRHGGRDNVTVVVVDVAAGADPATLPDDGPGEPRWAEGIAEPAHWADDDSTQAAAEDATELIEGVPADDTALLPVVHPSRSPDADEAAAPARARRRFGLGAFLFWFVAAAILTVAVVVALVALRGDGDDPAPSTTSSTSTAPTTSTSSSTSSTSTTPGATSAPGTTAPPGTTTP